MNYPDRFKDEDIIHFNNWIFHYRSTASVSKFNLFSTFHFYLETITDIIGVVGFPVELPCDVQPAVEGDQLLLILWYKEGYSSPIYT